MGHGLLERVRTTEGTHPRVALTSVTALVASAVLMAGGMASDSRINPNSELSPALQIGAGVSVASPDQVASGRAAVVVKAPANDGQISITGAPSAVVVDPKTAQVLSVRRAPR